MKVYKSKSSQNLIWTNKLKKNNSQMDNPSHTSAFQIVTNIIIFFLKNKKKNLLFFLKSFFTKEET